MATTLLDAWCAFCAANTNLHQFGQVDDESTYGGATGCTHTVLQALVKAKTGKYYTHDQISSIAGYPWPAQNRGRRGMRWGETSEVSRVLNHFGLPYVFRTNLDWEDLVGKTKLGPIMFGIRYGYWPEDVGYVYNGRQADGKPGGYAFRNGKTQLYGAEQIYHAVLGLGQKSVSGITRFYAREPNHGSASRPEKPDYDSIRATHASRAYNQYGSTGRDLVAFIPTKTFRPKGY